MNQNVLNTRSVVTIWPRFFHTDRAPREVLGLAALVVPKLLVGEHPAMAALREQYERARIWRVDLTDGGFFVGYEIPDDAPRALPADFVGGDANIQVAGVDAPTGCRLWVRKGQLATLEGYTCADIWPKHPEVIAVEDVCALRPPDVAPCDGVPRAVQASVGWGKPSKVEGPTAPRTTRGNALLLRP